MRQEQTICDEAEELWSIYIKSGKKKDRQKYLRHVRNCPEDFTELKEK